MSENTDALNSVRESASAMGCIHCQGKMERGTAPFHIDRKGYHLMFDSIRAWVCIQCGEAYFDEPQVEVIQDAISALDHRALKMTASI